MIIKEFAKKFLLNTFPGLFHRIRLHRLFNRFIKYEDSYLVKTGFIDSFIRGYPVDLAQKPLPWMNYPFLSFIDKRLNKNLRLFEYGSGYSTTYFAIRTKSITSVEYNKDWLTKSKKLTHDIPNAEIVFQELNDNYPTFINNRGGKYEIIIIDGRERTQCALNSLECLTSDGVLILDDSSREEYRKIWDFYLRKGFKELTFEGLKPNGFSNDHTTIFYRNSNCLKI